MAKKIINHEDQEARAYNWALLATFVLFISLIVQTPARLVSHFLPSDTRSLLGLWGGSIWSGQVNGQFKGLQGQLRWQLRPLALLKLQAGINWELITSQSHAQGLFAMGMSHWQLQQVQAQLATAELQSLMSGWQLPNPPLEMKSLDLYHQKDSWQDSKGLITWQGGPLDYVFNGQRQHVNLPPVLLNIQGQQGSLLVSLNEQQGANLANFIVTGGRLESRLTQRLLAYSPSYHGVAEPDAVVVTATQPLSSL